MKPADLIAIPIACLLAVSLTSCQAILGGSDAGNAGSNGLSQPAGTPTPTPVDLTALALSATPSPTPTPSTPSPTPTITPTPTNTPTPIPPSAAVRPAADALSTKLAAFRTALAAKNLDKLSAAQLALLDEADRSEQSLQNDKSREAQLVREAIADIRSGAGGQTQMLDSAGKLLSQVSGGGLTPTTVAGQTTQDLQTLTNDLRQQLNDYQQARRERNADNLLRRQAALVQTLSGIVDATNGDNSPTTKQLRDSATNLRRALSGSDTSQQGTDQLNAAIAQLQAAVGAAGGSTDTQSDQGNGDLQAQIDSLQKAATSFKSALNSGNTTETARLQRDLLDQVTRAQSSLSSNQSASTQDAQTLKDALSALRDGASGDTAKLDDGLNKLSQLGASGSNQRSSTSSVDVKQTAQNLQGSVAALQRAIQSGNSSDQLRLQRDLYDQATKIEPQLQGDSSHEADALRGAIGAIKAGASGETGKLDEANRQLAVALGQPTPAAGSLTPTAGSVDLGVISGSLGNRLSALQDATQRGDPAAIAKAQQDLRAEIAKDSQSLNGVQSAKADSLRAAVTAAGEAANGDPAKLKSALDLLHNVGQ